MSMNILNNIRDCTENQNNWRGHQTLNLIASENIMSQTARSQINSDFHHRYAEGLVGERAYQGQKYQDQIEQIAIDQARILFEADFADVRAPTATIANLAVFYAFCKPGDPYFATTVPDGAHISYRKFGGAGCRKLNIHDIPYLPEQFNIDIDQFEHQILEHKPKLITLGGSVYLFPHPVHEISKICEDTNTIIHYDGSHVLGLIAGKHFQDPLQEGADLLLGSTHKTFPGPQGALIMGNSSLQRKNPKAKSKLERKIFPGLVSNHHLWRLPPLAVTLLEMQQFGQEYASQTIHNAQALGHYLDKEGISVIAKKFGYTKSHQLILDLSDFRGGGFAAKRLEDANIICNKNLLYKDDVSSALDNPSGIRIGTQEITRLGMKESDMQQIAHFIARLVITDEDSEKIKKEIVDFRQLPEFQRIMYSFD
jgi:glycine hydroxymethyltransferase